MTNRNGHKNGFTLVEVIVILVILAVLAAIMIPAMTGWIDKAKQKSAIVGCRTCVVAAQTLASEAYGKDAATATSITPAEALSLAGLGGKGEINGLTIVPPADVDILVYTDKSVNAAVIYRRTLEPHYVFAEGGVATLANGIAGVKEAFTALRTNPSFEYVNPRTGNTVTRTEPFKANQINGVNVGVTEANPTDKNIPLGMWATAMYNSLPTSQQAFLNTVSWSIRGSGNSYALYFSPTRYGKGSGEVQTTVYKYDLTNDKYYKQENGIVKDGEVQSGGQFILYTGTEFN